MGSRNLRSRECGADSLPHATGQPPFSQPGQWPLSALPPSYQGSVWGGLGV